MIHQLRQYATLSTSHFPCHRRPRIGLRLQSVSSRVFDFVEALVWARPTWEFAILNASNSPSEQRSASLPDLPNIHLARYLESDAGHEMDLVISFRTENGFLQVSIHEPEDQELAPHFGVDVSILEYPHSCLRALEDALQKRMETGSVY